MAYWINQGSCAYIVSVVTRLWAGQPRIRILVGTKFFSCSEHPDWPWGTPILLFSGYWGSFLGVKQPGNEVQHLLPRLIPLLPDYAVMVCRGTALAFAEFV